LHGMHTGSTINILSDSIRYAVPSDHCGAACGPIFRHVFTSRPKQSESFDWSQVVVSRYSDWHLMRLHQMQYFVETDARVPDILATSLSRQISIFRLPLGEIRLNFSLKYSILRVWGHSSAGRALAWHARGRRFDPAWLHQISMSAID
jgi:hypothetical protein